MDEPTPEERRVLTEVPRGTWVLTLVVVVSMLAAWLALYIGKFLAQGPVN
jgi:uncharacterized membrane protein